MAILLAPPALIYSHAMTTWPLSTVTMMKRCRSAPRWRNLVAKRMNTTFLSLNGECILKHRRGLSGGFLFFKSFFMPSNKIFRWFDSSHVHGTIMPRASTVKAARLRGGANSKGDHKTYPKKNYDRARKRRIALINRARKNAFWQAGYDEAL